LARVTIALRGASDRQLDADGCNRLVAEAKVRVESVWRRKEPSTRLVVGV
jgi:hypothetical protein